MIGGRKIYMYIYIYGGLGFGPEVLSGLRFLYKSKLGRGRRAVHSVGRLKNRTEPMHPNQPIQPPYFTRNRPELKFHRTTTRTEKSVGGRSGLFSPDSFIIHELRFNRQLTRFNRKQFQPINIPKQDSFMIQQ